MEVRLGECLEKMLIETIKNLKESETETFNIEVRRHPDKVIIAVNAKIIFWVDPKMLEETEG